MLEAGAVLLMLEERAESPVSEEAPEAGDPSEIRTDLAATKARLARTLDAARPEAVAKRHAAGKRTARENVDDLLDTGSFNEYGALVVAGQRKKSSAEELIDRSPADGLVLGTGTVNAALFDDARCAVMAYDYTVMGGSQGFMNHKKTDRLLAVVKQLQIPLVCFAEGGGGRSSDTDFPLVSALDLHTFHAFAQLVGQVPTIGIAEGNCFAGNAALFGMCDITIATETASIGMAGPVMVEGGGLGSYRPEEIGPVSVQAPNGVVDVVVKDEAEAAAVAKQYLSPTSREPSPNGMPQINAHCATQSQRIESRCTRYVG